MIVDANVNLSRWPFRRLRGDEPEELAAMLRARGVERAWAGSFDALLHKDLSAVNSRLADDCRRRGGGLFVPFGSVNPKLPDWEEDLRRCHEVHRMPGLRLHPGYHGYALDDADFLRLLRQAAERRLVVQLAMKMEDERTQHPLMRVKTPDVNPLIKALPDVPGLRLVMVNSLRDLSRSQITQLRAAGDVWFEISMVEGVGGVMRLADEIGHERLLLGTYAPFFYIESAFLKMREAALGEAQTAAIQSGNARRLVP
jgi:predicted TIM-barrel fold metal-dependent hydrolase